MKFALKMLFDSQWPTRCFRVFRTHRISCEN